MAAHRSRTQRSAEPIDHALTLLPDGIWERVANVEFVAGVDPVFVGVHRFETTPDGRSYRSTACALAVHHQRHRPCAERAPKVVLPEPSAPSVVIHELGHVLHEAIDYDCHVPEPVTAYAQVDDFEAFAEAFTAWVLPHYHPWTYDLLQRDEATVALFEELARA